MKYLLSYPYVVVVLGQDFTEPSPLQLNFSSGDVINDTACTSFGIVNDDNLEFDHEFSVTLGDITAAGTTAPCIALNPTTTVSISDDEGICCIVCVVLTVLLLLSCPLCQLDASSVFLIPRAFLWSLKCQSLSLLPLPSKQESSLIHD